MTAQRKILVLHGDRQTGSILVGRMASLKRKLLKARNYDDDPSIIQNNSKIKKNSNSNAASSNYKIELVAPDGPCAWKIDPSVHHVTPNASLEEQQENDSMRTWWNGGCEYGGLDDALEMLHSIWGDDAAFEGIIGFSRGARLAHLVASLHEVSGGKLFPNLRYVIMASGYGHVPMPDNFPPKGGIWSQYYNESAGDFDRDDFPIIKVRSMHIMGIKDRLVPVEASRALLPSYVDPVVHEHEGGHHVPMRAADVRAILTFIDGVSSEWSKKEEKEVVPSRNNLRGEARPKTLPDEEHALTQKEECDSLSIIFPDEFQLLSATNGTNTDEFGEEQIEYVHPISYAIQLKPPREQLEHDANSAKLWPKKGIALKVEYNAEYPDCTPTFSLYHDMNLLEFKICQEKACLDAVKDVAEAELGMPCVMSCVYRALEFFEEGGLASSLQKQNQGALNADMVSEDVAAVDSKIVSNDNKDSSDVPSTALKPSSQERIKKCIDEGLQVAYSILGCKRTTESDLEGREHDDRGVSGKGGTWKYTIGLVGKPSAGKLNTSLI